MTLQWDCLGATADAARLIGESDRIATLQPCRHADLVAYRSDPLNVPADQLRDLRPALTMVGGAIEVPSGTTVVAMGSAGRVR